MKVIKEAKTCGDAHQRWNAGFLSVNATPTFKRSVSSKPKRKVKSVNWSLPGLYSVAQFLRSLSPDGPPANIIEGVAQIGCVYIVDQTLFVDALCLFRTDDLNFISLATHLRLVKEVRIHTFHIDHYLTSQRLHYCLQSTSWGVVRLILSHINRGPWVQEGSGWQREIKVTFDEFLKPAIEAWKEGLPYAGILANLPEYETDMISTYSNLKWVHSGIDSFAEGYSSKSEFEVDYAHMIEVDSDDEDYDVMVINGIPFILEQP